MFISFAKATARATSKTARLLFFVAIVLSGGVEAVRGQSARDGFDPNANGRVRVVVVQLDGKILLGGDFTTLSPDGGVAVARNRIARLNPDGTLDTAFNPAANNDVLSIAVQADGKILVGGVFTSIGGQTRNYIARVDATTGLADSFDPNASGNPNGSTFVRSIAVQADEKILVGGFFTSIGGQARNNIARLDAATGLADSFNPIANSEVFSIALQADGRILAGGVFSSIGGQTRNRIARLDPTTALADSFDPNANIGVWSVVVQADGKILAGGSFTAIGGQSRNGIARLDATTGLADSFNPDAHPHEVFSIAVQADGKILAGGSFSIIGGQGRNCIARLDATTGLADSFDPNVNTLVWSIAVQADGKILVGGQFTALAPSGGSAVTRNRIARVETEGRVDQTLNPVISGDEYGGYINATAVQPDGKIIIGGRFNNVSGVERHDIARFNTDGTLDMAFNPYVKEGLGVSALAVQADGKILVGGFFHSIGGLVAAGFVRLDGTTGQPDSFNPNPSGPVYAITVQRDGKILVSGDFISIGGQARQYIARLDPATGQADSFNPNASNVSLFNAEQADGKILVGGSFSSGAQRGQS